MSATPRSIDKPLTEQDHARIRQDRARLHKLKDLLARLEKCGVDCQENRDLAQEMDDFLSRVETEFFGAAIPD